MYRMQLPPLHQAILKVFIFLPQSLDQKKKPMYLLLFLFCCPQALSNS